MNHSPVETDVTVPSSALSLLAFQLVDHWGNRCVLRPAPRADVLAAALLCDASSPPVSVERATAVGRYVGFLVSCQIVTLVASTAVPAPDLLESEERRRLDLRATLEGDARYRGLFRTGRHETNVAILSLAFGLARHLTESDQGKAGLVGLPTRTGSTVLDVKSIDSRELRLRPWPFAGSRLSVSVEGYSAPADERSDARATGAPSRPSSCVRLSWTLLAPATPTD